MAKDHLVVQAFYRSSSSFMPALGRARSPTHDAYCAPPIRLLRAVAGGEALTDRPGPASAVANPLDFVLRSGLPRRGRTATSASQRSFAGVTPGMSFALGWKGFVVGPSICPGVYALQVVEYVPIAGTPRFSFRPS